MLTWRRPSKRAYQTRFRLWDFPSKQNPAHKNDRLVARVRALWERNLSQREILRVLNEEDGFDISHRELMRVRAKNRWLLRMPNPPSVAGDPAPEPADRPVLPPSPADDGRAPENALSPQIVAKRRDQLHKLEPQSAERWVTRKRRRSF